LSERAASVLVSRVTPPFLLKNYTQVSSCQTR
jgi:hypothetical protein